MLTRHHHLPLINLTHETMLMPLQCIPHDCNHEPPSTSLAGSNLHRTSAGTERRCHHESSLQKRCQATSPPRVSSERYHLSNNHGAAAETSPRQQRRQWQKTCLHQIQAPLHLTSLENAAIHGTPMLEKKHLDHIVAPLLRPAIAITAPP